jgi:6,7-dimethyl-8-ribityllumazine synthase
VTPVRGAPGRFAIISSRYNELITSRLAAGARACLLEHGVAAADITELAVPGAWELPLAARLLARQGFSGIVALGCVIRGDTPHFEYVARAAADGLAQVSLAHDLPIGFGVLTTEDDQQALARAGGREGNKGWEAALAALEMAELKARLQADASDPQ